MTASLPVPNDIDPEEPDRHSAARVVPLPSTPAAAADGEGDAVPAKAPQTSAKKVSAFGAKSGSSGAKSASAKPASTKSTTAKAGQAKPKKKRAPRPQAPTAAEPVSRPAIDPGPPPPLPSDLEIAASAATAIVVPPKPPLPPSAPAVEDGTASSAPESVETRDAASPAPVEDATVVVPEEAPPAEEVPAEEASAEEAPAEEAPAEDAAPAPAAVTATSEHTAVAAEESAVAAEESAVVAEDSAVTGEDVITEPEPVADLGHAASALVPTDEADVEAPAEDEFAAIAPAPSPAAGADVLVLRGVTKRFGSTHAVEGIDLTVPAGTFYGLVGPNGAGKTTTLSIIAGLLEPDRGTVVVGGVDAAAKPLQAKKLMGVLPDRLRTFDRLTGRQLLYYYGVLRRLPAATVESRTADLARAFDLEEALGRSVSDYSAGMLKKVMLAGALIHSPRLLVLDEPFEAVDPVSSAVILDILKTYVAHGGTVILSSHGMELVERVCSRVAVIVAGQVLAEGTIDEVRGELTLEQRFVELAGGLSDVEGLEWLHTFSG